MIYALWHGGINYAAPYVSDDTEAFDTISQAVNEFRRRAFSGYGTFDYISKPPESIDTPCARDGASMSLYFYDPTADDVRDPYPDRLIEIGPRGGIQVSKA